MLELGGRESDRYAFEWIRSGVLPDLRRTLPELAGIGGFTAGDRRGALLGFAFALVMLLVACKAVWL